MKAQLLSILLLPFWVAPNPSLASSTIMAQTAQHQEAEQQLFQGRDTLDRGSLEVAKGKFSQALKMYQTLQDKEGQVNALVGLARIEYQQARYSQALVTLRKAQTLSRQPNGELLAARGSVNLELGDYRDALQDLRQGIHYLRVSGDRSNYKRTLLETAQVGLAETYLFLGQYQTSLHSLEGQINRTFDLHQKRRAYNILGTAQLELGQQEKALASFEQALNVPNIPGDRVGKAKTLMNLGRGYRVIGDRKRALKYYQQALAQFNSLGAWGQRVFVLNRLGELTGDLGLENRALEYLQEAEASFSSTGGAGRVVTLINLGNYYARKGDFKTAREYFQNALNWAVSNGDRIGETKALSGLGAIELQQGQIEAAIKTFQRSIEVFEGLRPGLRDDAKISLFDTQSRTYELLQQAYITQEQPQPALIVAERSRARAFLELLAQKLDSKTERETNLQAPQIQQIQKAARDRNATIVSYSIIKDQDNQESQLYIWVVNPQGEINFRQLDIAQLRNTYNASVSGVSQSTNQTAGGGADLDSPPIEDLENLIVAMRGSNTVNRKQTATLNGYKVLIEPIADLLPENPEQKTIFIPQGMLFLVPFAALQNDSGEYLIQNHTIQIAPSISSLILQEAIPRKTAGNSALIVGNPDPMPLDLGALPGTEAEAKTIAQMLGTEPLLNSAATESTIKEQISQADIIHFATHGLFNEYQGLESSLALVATDGDGFLTASEVLDLKLQADLVVLSACNTGRGRITGDGVVGLSRSFLAAGAKSTVSSLWYVPDLPTATLMEEFYIQLQQSEDKAQALRQAMLKMLQQKPHPINWAGFVYISSE